MSKKDYATFGEKRVIDGKTYYSQGYYDDGLCFGCIYKNEEAFYENKDEVCYIPEGAFEDVEPIEVDGERFYPEDEIGGYTRKDLEDMIVDDEGEPILDDEDEPIDIEYFFQTLNWCYPCTRIFEMAS